MVGSGLADRCSPLTAGPLRCLLDYLLLSNVCRLLFILLTEFRNPSYPLMTNDEGIVQCQ